jgi:hypothetical protein
MLRDVAQLDERARCGRSLHQPTRARAGSTRTATRTPRALASRQTTTTTPNSIARSAGSRTTWRGNQSFTAETRAAPRNEADHAHQQSLLDDEADNGAVRRADQLERRDLAQLFHRQRIDDQGTFASGIDPIATRRAAMPSSTATTRRRAAAVRSALSSASASRRCASVCKKDLLRKVSLLRADAPGASGPAE